MVSSQDLSQPKKLATQAESQSKQRLGNATRSGEMSRNTSETDLSLWIRLDGSGQYDLDTEIPFFEHMLSHICKQSLIDMRLGLRGDIGIDCHHSVEDTAIVFGDLLHKTLGSKLGIQRYGHFSLVMDEVLATVALDLGGRFSFVYHGPEKLKEGQFGIYDAELSLEFFQKLAMHAKMNLHINLHYGDNRHHMHEAIFKAFGKSLAMAIALDPRRLDTVASTKGLLE